MRVITPVLMLTAILLVGCQRKTVRPEVPPPKSKVYFDDQLPEVEHADILVPASIPTDYVPYPTRDRRTPPARPAAVNQCEYVGEVWDFVGLDGCGLLVETTGGSLLYVIGLPQGYYLEGGSRIRFGFNYAEEVDMEGKDCMHMDAAIRITCLQLLRSSSGFPRPIVCRPYDESSQWINELIRDLSPTYITRFPWAEDRTVYLFETPSGQYLYDCRGFILCQPKKNCLKFIEDFSAGELIYEG